jgi:hypothetical protein
VHFIGEKLYGVVAGREIVLPGQVDRVKEAAETILYLVTLKGSSLILGKLRSLTLGSSVIGDQVVSSTLFRYGKGSVEVPVGGGYTASELETAFDAAAQGQTVKLPVKSGPSVNSAPARLMRGLYPAQRADVWKLPPDKRGLAIQNDLAVTEYKDWFHIGAQQDGKFPLIDFQNADTVVSLKTIDTSQQGASWIGDMEDHITDLATRGVTIDEGLGETPAKMILDIRVQPGGADAAKPLVNFAEQFKGRVTVKITEYP